MRYAHPINVNVDIAVRLQFALGIQFQLFACKKSFQSKMNVLCNKTVWW